MKVKGLSTALALLLFASSAAARDAEDVTPLLIGASVPKVSVSDEQSVDQFLPALTMGKRTILVFYRGGWCPYCSEHFQELAEAESEFVELGYQIIGLSPDSPEALASVAKGSKRNYKLYSDSHLEAAKAFGIDFTLGKATLAKYKDYGIDLERQSGGANKNKLPVPAVFIVGPDNKVAFAYVDPDYRNRVPGDLLLAAAKTLAN